MVDRVDDYLCTHLGLKEVLVSQALPKEARTTHGRLLLHSPHKKCMLHAQGWHEVASGELLTEEPNGQRPSLDTR
jgi:hypothetical protein